MTSTRALISAFVADRNASAAAEMALSTPILMALLFGSFELGSYFLAEHKVIASVRDGARYASHQSFSSYTGCSPSTTVRDNIRNVTRTGQVASGGTPRLAYWTNPATITVSTACFTSNPGGTVTYSGIYNGVSGGAPVVTVSAAVPYTPLIGTLGIARVSLMLNARSQATVNGA